MHRGFKGEPAMDQRNDCRAPASSQSCAHRRRNGDELQGIRTNDFKRSQGACCSSPTACALIVSLLFCVEDKTDLESFITESSRRIVAIVSSQTTASQGP